MNVRKWRDQITISEAGNGVEDHMMMMDGHMMPADNSIAMMMMQMTFYSGVNVTVLINQWKVTCKEYPYINFYT